MVPFKPSEIRIIVVLSVLALAGSVVTLMQRQGRISRLDLGVFSENSIYNYHYSNNDLSRVTASDSNNQLKALSTVPEAVGTGVKIDLNHSGLYDIEALPGIGPVMAQRIIDYRDSLGGYKSVDDLKKVKGIGPAKFALLKDKVTAK
jgi:competence ComEA-like helix-hairpin-helix protein